MLYLLKNYFTLNSSNTVKQSRNIMANYKTNEPRLRDTFKEDFRRKDLFQTLRKEFKELTKFFIEDDKETELKRMGIIKRYFYMTWWLLKILFLKLTPLRRILLLIGVVLVFFSGTVSVNNRVFFMSNSHILGGLLILFVLMLELKDKLLAKTELQEGKAVQKALMPVSNPDIHGWDICIKSFPANDVGGDLIDFFQINESKYALVLGDISGKGLGAALMMSKLQSTIRALYLEYERPELLIESVNKIFYRDSLPHQFASLIYIELDTNSNSLSIVNAGHLPPIIVKENEPEVLKKGGIAIGLAQNSKYSSFLINLNNKEQIFVYSDGLTETMNEYNQLFGEIRLKKILKKYISLDPSSLVDKILLNLSIFKGEAPIHDDVSILALKRKI